MVKPLDQFGGWLLFFHITNWIVAIINASFLLLLVVIGLLDAEYDAMEGSIYVLTPLVHVLVIFKMIMATRIRDSSTPNKIVGYVRVLFGCVLIIGLSENLYMYLAQDIQSVRAHLDAWKQFTGTFIWYSIWFIYFQRSKRVSKYYGARADPEKRVAD